MNKGKRCAVRPDKNADAGGSRRPCIG